MARRSNLSKYFLAILAFLIFLTLSIYIFVGNEKTPTLLLGSRLFEVELATTTDEKAKGLSGRESLPQDTGLLFVYEQPKSAGIWMKDMNFAIDVAWINEGYEVIHIVEGMQPNSYTDGRNAEVYRSEGLAKYVLEVNEGVFADTGLRLGQKIDLKIP